MPGIQSHATPHCTVPQADIVINRTEVNDASAADPDARPAVAGGPPAVQLVRNLTVVGAAEGSVTLLDWNFLTARVMVRRGVTLTFSRVELFKVSCYNCIATYACCIRHRGYSSALGCTAACRQLPQW